MTSWPVPPLCDSVILKSSASWYPSVVLEMLRPLNEFGSNVRRRVARKLSASLSRRDRAFTF